MNQKVKFSFFFLTFIIAMILNSCIQDDDMHKNEYSNLTVKEIRLEELQNDLRFNDAYSKVSKKPLDKNASSLSRTVMEEEYNFTIDNYPAKVMEVDTLVSYTFSINNETRVGLNFENLVINVNKATSEVKAAIIKYIPDSLNVANTIVNEEHHSKNFVGKIEATPIVYNATSIENAKTVFVCTTITTLLCNYGGHTHIAGERCSTTYTTTITNCQSVNSNPDYLTTPVQVIQDTSNPDLYNDGAGGSARDVFFNLISSPELAQFYNSLDFNTKVKIEYYLAHNGSNECIIFAYEAVIALKDGGEVDFDNEIIYLINKPCQNQIIKDVIEISSPFTNLIKQTFNSSENINVKFSNGTIPGQVANAYTNPIYNGTSDNFTINILFDNTFLENSTDLGIIATTLHELVHAYLMKLYLKGQLVSTSSNYNDLLNAFVAFYDNKVDDTFSTLDNEIHNAMKDFIDKMGNSIYNYAISKNINVTPDFCVNLAWGTMSGTELFDQVLTPSQQLINNNIYAIEQDNIQTEEPKGTPCN